MNKSGGIKGNSNFSPRKKLLVLVIGLAFVSPSVFAADTAKGKQAEVEEIVVNGVRLSQAKSVDVKRKATEVVDAIVAEDIGKLPDATITDSLQRVTGVQINREAGEGTTLNVRGMPQVLTTLNGEQFLSPWSITGIQANFSDVPAGLLNGVDVYKSQSAKTLVGGISGVVDLKTLDPAALPTGFMARARGELSEGSLSNKEFDANGKETRRKPDTNISVVLGYNSGDKFSAVGNLYKSSSYAANYSMWQDSHLAFLNEQGGKPIGNLTDPHGLLGQPVTDWYLTPSEFAAASSFVERDRDGGSLTAKYEFNDNWSARGDVFYNTMDKYNRGVRAGFNGNHTPDSFQVNGQPAKRGEKIFDTLQSTSVVGAGHPFSYTDTNGVAQSVNIHSTRVADVWAADFQTTSSNEIERTAALNTNLELHYNNGSNLEATFRGIHAAAEKQYRKATFQQGTPAWYWVDDDKIPGKDPVAGYKVKVDYTADYPSFSYTDDLSKSELLKQYQGFAEGTNTDATLDAIRADFKFSLDAKHLQSIEGGVRYGVRSANNNKFYYVAPTGRYTDWEDSRVPVDKRYKLLPSNLIWQKYPNWLKFNFADTNSSLISVGGLQDNGFSPADTTPFKDFGPIKGFEKGVASLDPKAWDDPYVFMNRLYPGTRTANDPGYTYGVEEASANVYTQFNFANDDQGLFGLPYKANLGLQWVKTKRTVDKSEVPAVLDSFNSIGYDDWQKIAYVYTSKTYEDSKTNVLPSLNLNLYPTNDVIARVGIAKTMTRNDLEQVGSSLALWYQQCNKTDESGNPVMVRDPSNGQERQDTVGCIGGGNDMGNPHIKPWMATVINTSAEWYFAENSILGLGVFLIKVDSAVEQFQEQRPFLDLDGIDRKRFANIYTVRNIPAADVSGFELGYKQPFTFLPGTFLSSTGMEFNFTYSHSETKEKDILGNTLPLPANSEKQSNLILWYDHAGLNVRLAYNYRSAEFTERQGVTTNVTPIQMANWVEPVAYVDLSVSYQLNEHWNFFFNGTNLTEQSRKGYSQFTDQFQSLWVQEKRFSLGVNASF